jgi:hypothetical protein
MCWIHIFDEQGLQIISLLSCFYLVLRRGSSQLNVTLSASIGITLAFYRFSRLPVAGRPNLTMRTEEKREAELATTLFSLPYKPNSTMYTYMEITSNRSYPILPKMKQ